MNKKKRPSVYSARDARHRNEVVRKTGSHSTQLYHYDGNVILQWMHESTRMSNRMSLLCCLITSRWESMFCNDCHAEKHLDKSLHNGMEIISMCLFDPIEKKLTSFCLAKCSCNEISVSILMEKKPEIIMWTFQQQSLLFVFNVRIDCLKNSEESTGGY